jgi:hypothetical protein
VVKGLALQVSPASARMIVQTLHDRPRLRGVFPVADVVDAAVRENA